MEEPTSVSPGSEGPSIDEEELVATGLRDRAETPARAIGIASVVAIATAFALSFAFDIRRAGAVSLLASVGGTYVVLTAGMIHWLRGRGEFQARLAPQRGDLFFGMLIGLLGYVLAFACHLLLSADGGWAGPWLLRFYAQIGDPAVASSFAVGVVVLGVAGLEEAVWRGWVQGALIAAFGPSRGWLLATGLYALAHAPTLWLLKVSGLGLNPMVVGAALVGGAAWGGLAYRAGRLGPSIAAHAIFSWSVVVFPLWRY
ncbi:MAG: type II CAAX endopeptidase family protein [Myxococcota bacterium]